MSVTEGAAKRDTAMTEPSTLAEAIALAREAARVLVKAVHMNVDDDLIEDLTRVCIVAERRVGELA
jgi:hypothetical protein